MPIVERHNISDDDETHNKNIPIEIPEGKGNCENKDRANWDT